jgi:hypothetical protein
MLRMFRQHFREAKAELQGVAISKARLLPSQAPVADHTGPPAPTNVGVRMRDGAPMRYFTDGSIRHATGFKPGKAARKAAKRRRHGLA